MGSVVAHTHVEGVSGGTTPAIDTATGGANFIVVGINNGWSNQATISDSAGNSWTFRSGSGLVLNSQTSFYTCLNPTTSTTHTFTLAGGSFSQACCVLAFKTAVSWNTGGSESSDTNNLGSPSTTITATSITPGTSPALVLALLGLGGGGDVTNIDSSFTISDHVPHVVGTNFGVALAYKFQDPAAAAAPTWTTNNSIQSIANMRSLTMAADGVTLALTGSAMTTAAGNVGKPGISLGLTGSAMTTATGNLGGANNRALALVGHGMTFFSGSLVGSYGPTAGIGFPPPFPPVPEILTDPQDISFSARLHRRKIASAVNLHNQGKFNCVIDVTITPSAATTSITDARISPFSSLEIMAMDSVGAADIVAGIYFDTFLKGSCVMHHRNNASSRTLRITILG